MEELEQLYQTLKSLNELGLTLSPGQISAVKEKENEYIDKKIIPQIKDLLAPIANRMLSKLEISITSDRSNGLQVVRINRTPTVRDTSIRTPRAKATQRYIISVIYPDGHVDCQRKVAQTFLNVVNYAGPEKVKGLNIICNGYNIVTNPMEVDERYVARLYETCVKGQYLLTNSDTEHKLGYMQRISKELGLGLKFEKVLKE